MLLCLVPGWVSIPSMHSNWRSRSPSVTACRLKADDEDNKRIFASLRALSDYVQQKRAA